MRKDKDYEKLRRKQFKEQGLCTTCGESPEDGKIRCQQCRDKSSKYKCKYYQIRKINNSQQGLCTCGRVPQDGKKTCNICMDRTLQVYYNKKILGICPCCGENTNGKSKCRSCLDKMALKTKELRLEIISAYGGMKCNCCGENIEKFLTLDHVEGNGNKHRKQVGQGLQMYKWLKKNNYPPGFQILCWNCNLGRQLNGGICPHKEKDDDSPE